MNQYSNMTDEELLGLYRKQQLGAVTPEEPKGTDRIPSGPGGIPPAIPDGLPVPGDAPVEDGFDGLSDEDLIDMYQKKGGDMTRLREPPTAGEFARGATGGFNTGVAELLGAPVDIMSAAIEFVGVPKGDMEPALGSEWFKQVFGKMEELAGQPAGTLTQKGPDTPTGRILGRVFQELGAGIVPAGVAVRGAKAVQSAIPKGGLKELVRSIFTETAGKSPSSVLASEIALLGGAGAGAGIAGEIAPGSQSGEITGQLLGGTAVALSPTKLATKLGSKAFSKLSRSAQQEAAKDATGQFIEDDLTTEALERLDSSQALIDEIPGLQLTTAERTQTPGLLEAQKRLEMKATPEAVKRRAQSEQAVETYAAEQAPAVGNDLEFVIDTARQQVDDVRNDLTRAIEGNLDEQARLAERNTPPGEALDAGIKMRQSLEGRFGEEQQIFTQYAEDAGLNDDSFMLDYTGVSDNLENAYKSASKFVSEEGDGLAPPSPAVLRALKGGDEQSLPAWLELRSDIAAELRTLESQGAPDSKALRGMKAMKKQFDEEFEEAIEQSGNPELIDRFREFNQRYRNDIVEIFKTGPTARVLSKNKRGFYQTPDEKVAEAYFRPGHVSAANQFNKVFKGDPMAKAALRDAALDSLNRAVVKDGRIKQANLTNWLGRHRTVLDQFPDLRDEINSTVDLQETLAGRARVLEDRKAIVEDRMLTRRVDSFTRGTIQPDQILEDAVLRPRLMADLVESLDGSPEALAGLRRAVWDKVAVRKPGSIGDYLDAHAGSLDLVLSDKHRKALKTIDGARALLDQTPTPTPNVQLRTLRDKWTEWVGMPPDMLANRAHTLNTGRSEPAYIYTNILFNVFGRKQQALSDAMMREALYNPQTAIDMAQALRGGSLNENASSRLGARWFALGLTPVDGLSEDEE